MGREIRRVPSDWNHPKYTVDDTCSPKRLGQFKPIYDEDYDTACIEWYQKAAKYIPEEGGCKYYHDYDGTPDKDDYRDKSWSEEEATHYQVYETVSEGTPVTPHFATKNELIEYLVKHGDYWDQNRGHGGWDRKAAEVFVKREWAPSGIMHVGPSGSIISAPKDESFYK